MLGGPGGDAAYVGRGRDRIRLGDGDDGVFIRPDGVADVVLCGAGDNMVYTWRHDEALDRFVGCEKVMAGP